MQYLNVDALLREARERTGFADFGPDDFLEGLRVFVDSINTQGQIRDDRCQALHERLLRQLTNRLWFAADLKAHPEIDNEAVGSPVIIVSLPRTGSTKLHRMLGAGGDFRTLSMWQTHMFARIPGLPEGGVAERIAHTRVYEKWMSEASPEILTGHPMLTDEAEEDQWLGECTFRQPLLAAMFNVPDYGAWLMQADPQPMFDYFARQLKYLQWQFSPEARTPFLLKSPNYLGNEQWLNTTFNKPRFIVTHRDPMACVPSSAKMAKQMRLLYSDAFDNRVIGAALAGMTAHMAEAHMHWRESHPEVDVLDLGFCEINEDSMTVVRKVYDFFGMPLSSRAEQSMRDWEAGNPRDKHGRNVYSLEEMGIGEAEWRPRFAAYTQRYAKFL